MLRRLTAYSLTLTFILVACGADPTPLPTVSAPPVVKITPGVPPTATQPLAPAATAAPTSTPAVLMGPDSYPAGINPLAQFFLLGLRQFRFTSAPAAVRDQTADTLVHQLCQPVIKCRQAEPPTRRYRFYFFTVDGAPLNLEQKM